MRQGRDRGAVLRAGRLQPELPDRRRRHRQLRPRRLFRPRRLRRGPAGHQARPAHGAGADRWRRWSPALGAALFGFFIVRLSGIYLAMLTLAFAQIIYAVALPVGRGDRRRQRRGRRLAVALGGRRARSTTTWSLRCALAAIVVLLRGSSTRRSATRCGPRAIRRCAPTPSASTCARTAGSPSSLAGARGGPGRRAVRLLQGLDRPDADLHPDVGRLPGHGAARRRPDGDRAAGRARRCSIRSRTSSCRSPTTGGCCSGWRSSPSCWSSRAASSARWTR